MPFSRAQLRWRIVTLLATFTLLGGCKKPLEANIVGVDGKDNVPVNAVFHVRYESRNWIAKKYLNKKYFRLTNCVDETPVEKTAAKEEPGTSQEPEKKETATPSEPAISLSGYIIPVRTESKAEDGTRKRITDVYFVPRPQSLVPAPLDSDTTYCFSAEDVMTEGEDSEVALGNSARFRTEKDGMGFATADDGLSAKSSVKKKAGWIAGDPVLAEFSAPVNPVDLSKATHLCNQSQQKRDSDRICNNDGAAETRMIYMLEDLTENAETGFITAGYNLFAIAGDKTFNTETDYLLNLGVMLEGDEESKTVTVEQVEFTTGTDSGGDLSDMEHRASLVRGFEQTGEPAKNADHVTWILIDSNT
jgi:hypothetical protein